MDRSSKAKLKHVRGSQPNRACRGNIGHEKRHEPKTSSAGPPYCWCDAPLGDHRSWGSRRFWSHAKLGMTAIIPSTGSCQVLCGSLDVATVLRIVTLHDHEDR